MAAVLGSVVVGLDSTIVGVALPRIGQELPTQRLGVLEGQAYVYNAYLLAMNALLILGGAVGDYYGRRRMFGVGLVAFGGASLACGLAPTMEVLVVCRFLQGAAGALLVPGALALIRAAYSGDEVGRAYGIWAGASAGATILAPFLGGLAVDALSWRVAFLANVPVVLMALWVVRRYVPESRNDGASRAFHWAGAALVALGVGGLAFGAIYGQQRDWQDPAALVALAVGGAATLALPWAMRRSEHPLVPLELFKSRNFTVTNVSTLIIYGALAVAFTYLPLYLQGTVGYTAAAAGLALLPGTVLLALLSSRVGTLADRYGPRWFMAVGPAIMAVGVLWLVRLPAVAEAWALRPGEAASFVPPAGYLTGVLPGIVVFGLGLTIMVAPLTTTVMTSVPERSAGVASAVNNAISGVGPQLASALVFVAITAVFYRELAERAPGLDVSSAEVRRAISPLNRPAETVPVGQVAAARDASSDAFRVAMLVGATLLAAGAVVNAAGIRNPERVAVS